MKTITMPLPLSLPQEELLFDLKVLYRLFQTVPDQRRRQGQRYPLASVLMIGVLARIGRAR